RARRGAVPAPLLSIAGGIVAFFLTMGITPGRGRALVRRITIAATGLAAAGIGISLFEGMFTPPELRSVIGLATMSLSKRCSGLTFQRGRCGVSLPDRMIGRTVCVYARPYA
ncbi:hypothetical protein, partial [Azospirillum sp.]|uniref:hypothetical protein n=1 Tax=Azospirillum sp. TaxID=34012 RepID=UPI002D2ABDC0